MATDDSRGASRRKPTRRTTRSTTPADAHYSKLTRKPSGAVGGSRRTTRTSGSAPRPARSSGGSRRSTGGRDRAAQGQQRRSKQRPANYKSLAGEAQRKTYGKRAPKRNNQNNLVATAIGIAVIAFFILSGILFWTHRSVRVTVNGSETKIRINSTLEKLYDKADVTTTQGDYVTVGGNVIEAGKGYVFNASVDGKELTRRQTNDYRIHGGEQIEFSDGGNRTEKYEVSYREQQPKLVFEGSWGSVSYVKQWGKVGKQEVRTGTVSGETADGKWVDELQDCIVMTKNIEPADGQKLVALTFDDGPAATYTEQCLDILAEKSVKATFFNLSLNESELPDLAKKVAASGNQICSHTNQHLDLATLGATEMNGEITSAHDTILQLTGVDTTIIRPPYGSFTQNSWLQSAGNISASIIWNQDTTDWSLPGTEVIVQNALASMTPGSIILMHDGGGARDQTMEALPTIIDELKADGYTFVTVSELLASDPDVPAEIAAGNATMPADAVWPTEIGESAVEVK